MYIFNNPKESRMSTGYHTLSLTATTFGNTLACRIFEGPTQPLCPAPPPKLILQQAAYLMDTDTEASWKTLSHQLTRCHF